MASIFRCPRFEWIPSYPLVSQWQPVVRGWAAFSIASAVRGTQVSLFTKSRTGERTQRQVTATGLCSEGTSSLCWSPIMASAHRLTVRSGVGIQTELKYNEGKPNALRIPFPSSIRLGSSKHTAITTKAAVLARAATSADVAVSSPTYVDQEDFAKAGGSELDFALLQAAKEMDDQAKISKTVMRLKSPLSAL